MTVAIAAACDASDCERAKTVDRLTATADSGHTPTLTTGKPTAAAAWISLTSRAAQLEEKIT